MHEVRGLTGVFFVKWLIVCHIGLTWDISTTICLTGGERSDRKLEVRLLGAGLYNRSMAICVQVCVHEYVHLLSKSHSRY